MKSLSYTSQQFRSMLCSMAFFLSGILFFNPTARGQCTFPVSVVQDTLAGCAHNGYGANVLGGAPPYTYQWSNGALGQSVCQPLLLGQSICVTVTDAVGCQGTACYLKQCNMYVQVAQDLSSSCSGQLGFVAYPGNSYGPFTYSWDNGGQAAQTCAMPALGQSLCVSVTDAAGCQATACFTPTCNISGNIYESPDSVVCQGSEIYSVPIVTGGMAPYSYLWSNSSTAASVCANLGIGQSICVSVTDVNGCQATMCYTKQCQLSAYVYEDPNAICSQGTTFVANNWGAVQPVQFTWSNGQHASSVCQPLPLGQSICVTVTDGLGCQATSCYQATCNVYGYLQQSFDSTSGCVGFGAVVYSAQGGVGPYTYLWPDGSTGQSGCIQPGAPLCVQITDANGCQASACYQGGPLCQASFSQYLLGNNEVQFQNYSVYNPVSASWSFGDGSSSTDFNPTHVYSVSGTYHVCLTSTDGSGCYSSDCHDVVVGALQLDVAAFLYGAPIEPGFPFTVSPLAYNAGNVLASGTITYQYPPNVTFVNANPAPVQHDVANRRLVFNYGNLIPGYVDGPNVTFLASQALGLGSVLDDSVWVTPLATDVAPINNGIAGHHVVVGSFDPNDKAVSPAGVGPEGVVPQNTVDLGYKIRFQNTGTAAAHKVVIRDSLDASIDPHSVMVQQGSHPHRVELNGNELIITFDDINLADSNTNEAASHGFITYNVKLKSGLPVKTRVRNTARIYFDFNEPVYTNTTLTTLGLATGIDEVSENFRFVLVPNPTQSSFRIVGEENELLQVSIVNTLGEEVKHFSTYNNQTIPVNELPKGVYLVKAGTGNRSGVQRLLITE